MKFWDFINWTFLWDVFILCLSALLIVVTLAVIVAIVCWIWDEMRICFFFSGKEKKEIKNK